MASLTSVISPLFLPLCTPQLLSRKDKATFDRLDYLMSKEDNYKRLRDYISSQSMVSCIPYLGNRHKQTHTQRPPHCLIFEGCTDDSYYHLLIFMGVFYRQKVKLRTRVWV